MKCLARSREIPREIRDKDKKSVNIFESVRLNFFRDFQRNIFTRVGETEIKKGGGLHFVVAGLYLCA